MYYGYNTMARHHIAWHRIVWQGIAWYVRACAMQKHACAYVRTRVRMDIHNVHTYVENQNYHPHPH